MLVDAQLRTSDPDVYAIGDIANHDHPVLGRRVRVEHWETAIEQGKTAAHNLAGAAESYERMPYFFTDQYDLGMEYVGSVGPDGYDRVDIDGDLHGWPSGRTGSRTTRSSPPCTSTTGTPRTRSERASARPADDCG